MKIIAETDSNSYMSVRVFGDEGEVMSNKSIMSDYASKYEEAKGEIEKLKEKIRELEERQLSKDKKLNEIKLEFKALNNHIDRRVYKEPEPDENAFNRAKSWFNNLIISWKEIDTDYEPLLNIKILDENFISNQRNTIELERLTRQMEAKLNGRIQSLIGDKLEKTVENLEKTINDLNIRMEKAENNIRYYMKNLEHIIGRKMI